MTAYFFLLIAIAGEVVGTTALKASYGMSKLIPSLIVVAGYSLSFWSLSIALKTLPVGVVYAIWAGLGIVCIAFIGVYVFKGSFTFFHLAGTALILVGIGILMLLTSPVKE